MVTAIHLIEDNKPLQKHWVKRVLAYLIDFMLVSIPAYLIFYFFTWGLGPRIIFFPFPFMAGILQVFYSASFEYTQRRTIGKMFMNLEVEGLKGGMDMSEAMIRNFSKVQGLLVFLDTIVGMVTEGDPRQRYLDRVADTTVIGSNEPRHIEEFLSGHIHSKTQGNQRQSQQDQGQQATPPPPSQTVSQSSPGDREGTGDSTEISDDSWRG